MTNARFDSRTRTPGGQTRTGRIVFGIVMALVLLMGAAAFWSGLRLLLAGDPNRAGAITAVLMGAGFVALAIWYFRVAFVQRPIEEARLARIRGLYPGQPWMERKDWAARRVTSSEGAPALFMWVWVAGWWGAITLIGSVNGEKIRVAFTESWWNVAFVAIFVGAGLAGLWVAIAFTLSWWRYGRSTLVLDTLPAYTGEKFTGTLEARLSPKPTQSLEIRLVCEDLFWVETHRNGKRESQLRVRELGGASAVADPRRFTPAGQGLRGRIDVAVPPGLPSSNLDASGNGIRWQLRIASAEGDVPFSCSFDIPVYDRQDQRLRR